MSGRALLQARLLPVGGPVNISAGGALGWTERRGVRLELRDGEGRLGRGEAAPLPGYSPETLGDAAGALERATRSLSPLAVGASLEGWLRQASDRIDPGLPSARFALESALLDLAGQQLGRPAARLLGPGGEVVAVSTLIEGDSVDEVEQAGAQAAGRGYRTFKLKVGSGRERELGRVAALRRAVGPDAVLRLDANRSWSLAEAREQLRQLAPLHPELIEEPVAGLALLALAPSPVPLALDESLPARLGPEGALGFQRLAPLLRPDLVTTLVLKPALLGGLLAARDLGRRALAAGCAITVTHLFDGPVALAACAQLALGLAGVSASGLAPHRALAAFGGPVPSWLSGPEVRLPAASGLGLDAELAP